MKSVPTQKVEKIKSHSVRRCIYMAWGILAMAGDGPFTPWRCDLRTSRRSVLN